MKTIYTTLPVYNKLEKQCFERGRHAGFDIPVPIICPRHRLPSMQWKDESDGASSVTQIEMLNSNYDGSEEITAINWASNVGFDAFTNSGLEISVATNDAGSCTAYSNYFSITKGDQIRIIGTFHLNSGTAPHVVLQPYITFNSVNLAEGYNNIILVADSDSVAGARVYINYLGATDYTFTGVSITKTYNSINIKNWFVDLPSAHAITGDVYFIYNGDTLNYLLPIGIYYLKITMNNNCIYYSDWFKVDCVYENLLTNPQVTGITYDEFLNTNPIIITSAINTTGVTEYALSNTVSILLGETIRVITFLTKTSGQLPFLNLVNEFFTIKSGVEQFEEGLNDIELTATITGDLFVMISNTAQANWSTTEMIIIREYSEKYLTLNFSNTCDLGEILYQDGFEQTLLFESEPMETTFPQDEEGVKNGEGTFVRTFARQIKKYVARTKEMPDFMVDVFNRMKLHDSIELIDRVGDKHDVYNLEVDHEWISEDKYYAKIDLIFDYNEVVVIAGCCNNLT